MNRPSRSVRTAFAALALTMCLGLGVAPAVFAESTNYAAAQQKAQAKAALEAKVARIQKQQDHPSGARSRCGPATAHEAACEGRGERDRNEGGRTPVPAALATPDYFGSIRTGRTARSSASSSTRCRARAAATRTTSASTSRGHPDTTTFPGSDYYEIELSQYTAEDALGPAATTLRGYVSSTTAPTRRAQHASSPIRSTTWAR